jgi:hypothetical protein
LFVSCFVYLFILGTGHLLHVSLQTEGMWMLKGWFLQTCFGERVNVQNRQGSSMYVPFRPSLALQVSCVTWLRTSSGRVGGGVLDERHFRVCVAHRRAEAAACVVSGAVVWRQKRAALLEGRNWRRILDSLFDVVSEEQYYHWQFADMCNRRTFDIKMAVQWDGNKASAGVWSRKGLFWRGQQRSITKLGIYFDLVPGILDTPS